MPVANRQKTARTCQAIEIGPHFQPESRLSGECRLKEKTNNQYFIATHSAAFIDTVDAAIFHVKYDGTQTTISESIVERERFAICLDLGYRASDLLQSNAIIWVEGPSDRTYIAHWISSFAPQLIEGLHYSIMFYGGRLLSHLSATDSEVTEFIRLRRLNQNIAIVIDSDKSGSKKRINETKQRIDDEIKEAGGIVWITKGREIENYVGHNALQNAVQRAHPNLYVAPHEGGPYDHALHFIRKPSVLRS